MKYYLQSNWGVRAGHLNSWKSYLTTSLEGAIRRLEHDSNLARCIAPMRVVDSNGKVYKHYNPELDTRLPGCKYRMIRKNAYLLWNAACQPSNRDMEFWLQAEKELQPSNGLLDGDFSQEEINDIITTKWDG